MEFRNDPELAMREPPAVPKRDGDPVTPERRRPRYRVIAVAGGVLLVAAVAALALAVTRGSQSKPIAVVSNSVAVVEPKSGRVVADVAIGGSPVGIAIGEGAVWVANADDQTVVRINPKTYEVEKTIGGVGNEVTGIAVGFGSVWVANGNDGTVTRIDPRTNVPERTLQLSPREVMFSQPVFLVATGTRRMWALCGTSLIRIDPATNEVVGRTPVPGARYPSLGAGGGAAWLALGRDTRLLRIDEQSGRITARTSLPGAGSTPLVANGGVSLIVYEPGKSQIWGVDPASAALGRSVALPADLPLGLASGAGALWTADHPTGTLFRVDLAHNEATPVATVGHHPIAIAADDDAVWVGVQPGRLPSG